MIHKAFSTVNKKNWVDRIRLVKIHIRLQRYLAYRSTLL